MNGTLFSAKGSRLQILVLSIACLALTGCFDTKQEITLNPDGSGKAVLESEFTPTDFLSASAATTDTNRARDIVRKYVEEAEGVEAWRDVSFGEREDGTVFFRGTAYFTNLAGFKVGVAPFLRFSVTKDAAGQLTITSFQDTSKSPVALPKTNEAVTAESIQRERRQFRSAKPWLAATLGVMKQETVLNVPGNIRRISNFETNGPRSLRLRFDGARVLQFAEEVLFDPEIAKRRLAARSPDNYLTNDHLLNEKLFGQKAPVLAVIQSDRRPTFDYAAEVVEARKAFPEIARELALSGSVRDPAKPIVDGAPASVEVMGITLNLAGAAKRGVSPGYTLDLQATLPGAVLSVNKVHVDRAVTIEGVDLLSQQRLACGLSLSCGARDVTNLNFLVRLDSPPPDSKGLAKISGALECNALDDLLTVDLFSGTFRAGMKGLAFGTQIDEFGMHVGGGSRILLRTSLTRDQLRSLKVVTDSGQTMSLEKRGMMVIGGEHVHTYVSQQPIPRSGRLVAEIITEPPADQPTLRIPFSITNVSLLGQPLAAK